MKKLGRHQGSEGEWRTEEESTGMKTKKKKKDNTAKKAEGQ